MKKSIFITIFCFLLISFSNISHASELTDKADSAYNAQNYRAALTLYNQVLDTQGSSSELYYNIGNAHYRLGSTGKAVLNYERALRLNAANKDARANLEFVNSTIKGMPEDGSSFIDHIHNNIKSMFTTTGWSIATLCLFLLLLTCVALYLFAGKNSLRKTGFYSGFVVIVLFLYAFVIAVQTSSAPNRTNEGIVIRSNAKLTSSPGTAKSKGDKTISIPEGSKVEILDSLSTPDDPVATMWYNVGLGRGTQAWIDAGDIERI